MDELRAKQKEEVNLLEPRSRAHPSTNKEVLLDVLIDPFRDRGRGVAKDHILGIDAEHVSL